MNAKQFYLIILCLCLGTLASFAQGEDLSVKGRVVDEAGAKLAGVEITAKRISYNTKGYVASLANDPLLKNSSLADALRMLPGINLEEGSFSAFGEKIGSAFVNPCRCATDWRGATNGRASIPIRSYLLSRCV
ncbi:MAG: hypothetical protein PUH79_09550 [Hallella sp.]|uniref:hypothetical protein n=1 Tax=Hallella sp. TaxID=2980186 RepID=UPI00258CA1E1|nr:hypothetical protein [Hallella sp.]MDD7146401.1 hypothetical protein [Hallella sp.]